MHVPGAPRRGPDMRLLLPALSEAAILGALIVAALLVDPHSRSSFEPDKATLVAGLLLLGAGAAAASWLLDGAPRHLPARVARPLALLLVVWGASEGLSATYSLAPPISWGGSYLRAQGAWLDLAFLGAFAIVATHPWSWQRWGRMRVAIAAASVPVCLIALLSRLEPASAATSSAATGSTLGSPAFLAAYLLFPILVTADLLAERLVSPASALPAPISSTLLALQITTLALTPAHAARAGLAAAIVVVVLGAVAARRTRRDVVGPPARADTSRAAPFRRGFGAARGVGMVLCVAAILAAAAAMRSSGDEGIVRLTALVNPEADTTRARLIVWRAAGDAMPLHEPAVRSGPLRWLVGYGQETTATLLERTHAPELSRYEDWRTVPDRAHNQTLEILLSRGVLGVVAFVAAGVGLLGFGLSRAGALATGTWPRTCAGAAVVGGSVGYAAGMIATGARGVAIATLLVGMLVALLGLVAAPSRGRRSPVAEPRAPQLALLLSAALVGHLVETQFSPATTVSQLYFWVLAGALIALGAAPVARADPPTPRAAGTEAGLLVALIAVPLVFLALTPAITTAMIVAVAGIGASLTVMVLVTMPGRAAGRARLWIVASVTIALTLVIFIARDHTAATAQAAGDLVTAAAAASRRFDDLYAVTLAVVTVLAVVLAGRGTDTVRIPVSRVRVGLAIGVLVALGILLPRNERLVGVRADILVAQAERARSLSHFQDSTAIYRQAMRLRPNEVAYRTGLAGVLADWAARAGRQNTRDRRFARAEQQLLAESRSPLSDAATFANIARLRVRQAELTEDPVARDEHLAAAADAYRRAVALRPGAARPWAEWARASLLRGDRDAAGELFVRSLSMDPSDGQVYLWAMPLLSADPTGDARVVRELGPGAEMIAAADVYAALVEFYARAGVLRSAIAAAEGLARELPDEPVGHRALAVLHGRAGAADAALPHARRALELARGRERREIARLVGELEATVQGGDQ